MRREVEVSRLGIIRDEEESDVRHVESVVDDDLFSEDCLSSSTSAGSQVCKPNMMMVATNQSGVRNRVG